MVTPGRFELPIFALGERCIIQLCYGAMSYNNTLYTKTAALTIPKQYITACSLATLSQAFRQSRWHAPFHAYTSLSPKASQTNLKAFQAR